MYITQTLNNSHCIMIVFCGSPLSLSLSLMLQYLIMGGCITQTLNLHNESGSLSISLSLFIVILHYQLHIKQQQKT